MDRNSTANRPGLVWAKREWDDPAAGIVAHAERKKPAIQENMTIAGLKPVRLLAEMVAGSQAGAHSGPVTDCNQRFDDSI